MYNSGIRTMERMGYYIIFVLLAGNLNDVLSFLFDVLTAKKNVRASSI